MPAIANTFVTTDSKTNIEQFSKVAERIGLENTPLLSSIDTSKTIKGYNPQWAQRKIRAPGANVQPEGNEYAFNRIQAPVKVGNWTQIMSEPFIISGSQLATENAGDVLTIEEQTLDAIKVLKRDIEYSILSNVGSVGGATRVSAGLPAWLTSNVSRGAGGANGGFNPATGLIAPATNGTQRPFTRALMEAAMASANRNGATIKEMFVSTYLTGVVSTFLTDAGTPMTTIAQNAKGALTVNTAVRFINGPYGGTYAVTTDQVMDQNAALARNVLLLDTSNVAWLWLRKIHKDKDIAKTGDATKAALVTEGCLQVKNEAGNAIVADVFGMSANS